MTNAILASFLEIRGNASVDRVIADPGLNAQFVSACRTRGANESAVTINIALLNLRKRGLLGRLNSKVTRFNNQDEFAFAAEIAVRSLERKHRISLDHILCNPDLAIEFDRVAAEIAPGFSSLQYRWAALRLRKTSRLKPEIIGRVVAAEVFGPTPVAGIAVRDLPMEQGLYIFTSREKALYVGEARSLRARLKKHLDHSDNKLLARYITRSIK